MNRVQMGIADQHALVVIVDQPGYVGFRESFPQEPDQWSGADQIAYIIAPDNQKPGRRGTIGLQRSHAKEFSPENPLCQIGNRRAAPSSLGQLPFDPLPHLSELRLALDAPD